MRTFKTFSPFVSFGVVAAALLTSIPAHAYRFAGATTYMGNTNPSGSYVSPVVDSLDEFVGDPSAPAASVSTGPVSYTFSGLNSAGNAGSVEFSGLATARSEYGLLQTYLETSLNNALLNPANPLYYDDETSITNPNGVPTGFRAQASAYFADRLFITNPQATHIALELEITGQIDAPSTARSDSTINLYEPDPFTFSNQFFWSIATGAIDEQVTTPLFEISGGQVTFSIEFISSMSYHVEWEPALEGSFASTVSNFNQGVKLLDILAFDANGNRVSLDGMTTLSGTTYAVSAVPEPQAYVLMLAGLGLVVATARRAAGKRKG